MALHHAGLARNEKRYAVPFVASSIVLFAFGAYLAFVSFPHALQFLQNIGGPSLRQIYDPNSYLGLIVALMAVFGLTFEFPVILVSLELVGRPDAEEAGVGGMRPSARPCILVANICRGKIL